MRLKVPRGIDPTENDIGRKVIYRPAHDPIGDAEEGVITSFNAHSVFVRYGDKTGSQGTDRRDLDWAFP
jgi:hypothetical protein